MTSSGNGTLTLLQAKGVQDAWLTADPSMTFFKSQYARHSDFVREPIVQMNMESKLDWGKEIVFTLPRVGDLINKTYLVVDVGKLGSSTDQIVNTAGMVGQGAAHWTDSLGHAMIEWVQFECGGQIIDRHTGEYMEMMDDLTGSQASVMQTDCGGDSCSKRMYDIIGRHKGTRTNDNTEAIKWAEKDRRMYIPLQFWFCKSTVQSLPIVAMQYHEAKVATCRSPPSEA